MRMIPERMEQIWKAGEYLGDRRPVARVTVMHPTMKFWKYSLMSTYSFRKSDSKLAKKYGGIFIDPKKGRKVTNTYAGFLMNNLDLPRELPNVRTVNWQRSVDADVATCTITLLNTEPLKNSSAKPLPGQLDQPGYFTPDRGGTNFSKARWGQVRNQWFGKLMPDNIIRTYEGYGCDLDVPPEKDPNLVQTGTWIIDSVNIESDGQMTINCRDIGRILLDQMCYWPVIPEQFYPASWTNWDGKVYVGDQAVNPKPLKATSHESSNYPWIGSGTVQGHKISHAFDGNPNTYWLSIGNSKPSRRFAFEWVQANYDGKATVKEVKVRPRKTGYTCYISVKVNGTWQGTQKINYHEDGIGQNASDIHFLKSVILSKEETTTIAFDKPIEKVQAVRVTFGNLQNFGFGTYKYRAGIRDVAVYSATTGGVVAGEGKLRPGPAGSNPHRYRDYTDLVKLFCAWGGFYWHQNGYTRDCEGTFYYIKPRTYDTYTLGEGVHGRVWGDFQQSGTTGIAELQASNFDKQSLMDCINYVKEILGFVFFIDEGGGVQWRLPNVYDYGNWACNILGAGDGGNISVPKNGRRTREMVVIDERQTLIQLGASMDAKNVREGFFVGTSNGKFGAYVPGFNPNPTGLRRWGGWTDANFASNGECKVMAEMISIRQLFTYRKARTTIPGYPKIQIDDQVRIFERTAAEGYVHYVTGIASNLDMDTGEWTYELDTHWLGYDPKTEWLFKLGDLDPATRRLLEPRMPKNSGNILKERNGVKKRVEPQGSGTYQATDYKPDLDGREGT